ncbi:MAG: DUF3078 domain-containing protein [Bacteroidales bacterium]|jgi:hypothetical protein|nr:DUF3078 domain-containing protein [Bacteroidales bacterium]MDD4002506.1 DUF3078 domain-containing protein [Bacteroidales bacterium]MDD4529370.1 DUF3078 domain-containing protein [Bacteroidales bacterium]
MKRLFILVVMVFCSSTILFSQDDIKKNAVNAANDAATKASKIVSDTTTKPSRWYIKNNLTLNTEQNMFDNWEAGGVSSFAFSVFYKGFYNYHKKKLKWDNSVELGYGKMRQDNNGKGIFDDGNIFRKNEDKIELNSIIGYKAFDGWNYSALVNFKSQFDDGFKNDTILVSSFFAPAYLTTSIGLEYKPRPYISVLISPITGRTTFIANKGLAKKGNYGLTEDKQIDFAFGSYIKIFFEKEVFKNVNVLSKLEFFNDYNKAPFLTNTDINFETYVTMKVNKYLSAFVNFQVVYNYDFSVNLQFKERVGLSIPLDF